MLVRGGGILEPGVVADVDQPGRFRQRQADVLAEHRLKADRDPHRLSPGPEQWLIAITCGEVSHRNGHPVAEEQQQTPQRQIFAEHQQAALVIEADRMTGAEDAVVKNVGLPRAGGDAGHIIHLILAGLGGQGGYERTHLVIERRDRGLRPNDHIAAPVFRQAKLDIAKQRFIQDRRQPFLILSDVALNNGDPQRRSGGFDPGDLSQTPGAKPQDRQ